MQKVERNGRTVAELDQVIAWLTGYDADGLAAKATGDADLETVFAGAPAMTPKTHLITGVICGIRVEDNTDPVTRNIR